MDTPRAGRYEPVPSRQTRTIVRETNRTAWIRCADRDGKERTMSTTTGRGRAKVTHLQLRQMKDQGERIAMLTAYDASFARLCDQAGVDILLVGDSLGMVIQGMDNTLTVTMDQMIYHCRAVARGVEAAGG